MRPRASFPCRSPCASTKVWYGPTATSAPCSTRCSACSISWPSRTPSTLLPICCRCLLRRRQDGERTAQTGQPSRDPGQIQCGGLRSRPEEERPQDKGPTQDLWKGDKAEVFACECQINATLASPV